MSIDIKTNIYTLLNIYAPNEKKSRNVFFDTLSELLIQNAQGVKVIGGDFNEINDQIDRKTISKSKITLNTHLKNLIKNNKLTDIWRVINPSKLHFTWRRKNKTEMSLIDFWLIDSNIVPLVYSTDIRPAIIQTTDHMAISIKLKLPGSRGPGFWKLNNSLLSDTGYIVFLPRGTTKKPSNSKLEYPT